MSLEDTLREIVRAELRTALAVQRSEMEAELGKLRAAMSPRMLNRAALAEMLGTTPANLRTHLARRSKLGAKLLELAVVGLNGRQAWRPGDITAHCRPWLGRGAVEADDES